MLIAARVAAAPAQIEVTAGPAIAAAPANGLDPDVSARLDEAERASDANTAIDRVLVLYESDDPFSTAQRDAARPRSLEILTHVAERAHAAGDLVTEARALDARWTLGGQRRDPQLAAVLTRWAERDAEQAPSRALYLARRARSADPSHDRAERLDDDLSSNHRVWPGRLAIAAGIAAIVVGFWAQKQVGVIEDDLHMHARPADEVASALRQRDMYDAVGTGLLVAGPVLSIGGGFLILSGAPKYGPVSPDQLPALGAHR